MAYANGRLPDSALSSIPGGRLEHFAAAAWNAMNEALGGILRPLGSNSSYRLYVIQVYFWNLYQAGKGNLAAFPGTSNHGWGKAVDLAALFMRAAIDRAGRAFGWAKVEAPSEWWHVNYIGGFIPKPDILRRLGKRREKASRLLLYRRRERIKERGRTSKKYPHGKGPRWHRLDRAVNRSYKKVEKMWRRADQGPQKRLLRRVLDDRSGNL